MIRNLLVRGDGSEITSASIISCECVEDVNSSTNLRPGNATSTVLTVEIRGGFADAVVQGEEIYYFQVVNGVRKKVGTFTAELPTISSRSSYKLTAYDNISKLEKNMSDWLREHQEDFPMSLMRLAREICTACGIAMSNTAFPMNTFLVPYFYADDITARQIISWIAEISGRFVKCTPNGTLTLAWYTDTDTKIDSTKYKQGSLKYENYATDLVQCVRIKQSNDDEGVVYPNNVTGNTFIVQENMLLQGMGATELRGVASNLFDIVRTMSYTPCEFCTFKGTNLNTGDIITVSDTQGNTFRTLVMKITTSGNGMTIKCTGDKQMGSTGSVANQKFSNLLGKTLTLQKDVDGLKVANRETDRKFSELSLTVDGIGTRVGDAEANLTELNQSAGQVSVVAASEQGTLTTVISNDGTWESKYEDANGRVLSGISFDFIHKQFVFNGSGSFTGELNIGNGNFIVDVNGNVTAHGDTKIYGGKYYATNDDGSGGYTQMDEQGFSIFSADGIQRAQVGFPKHHPESPYILLNSGSTVANSRVIMKQFDNGMWLGNDAVMNFYGEFSPTKDCNGIFVSLVDAKTYVVSGENMQSIYTGESIAKFG